MFGGDDDAPMEGCVAEDFAVWGEGESTAVVDGYLDATFIRH